MVGYDIITTSRPAKCSYRVMNADQHQQRWVNHYQNLLMAVMPPNEAAWLVGQRILSHADRLL